MSDLNARDLPYGGWWITLNVDGGIDPPLSEEARRARGMHLPAAGMDSDLIRDPSHYEADQALLDAVEAAIVLGQPLLVTGEPGCGKTEVANFVAWQLGLEPPTPVDHPGRKEYALRFDIKSTTTAQDLFYTYDNVGRFSAAYDHKPDARRPGRFVTVHALGRAILDAASQRMVEGIETANWKRLHEAPRRAVVLIDEIDKAPRDVPNDLLMEIDRLTFRITELDRTVSAEVEHRPILVITSNRESALPDAFLRRCVFHYMKFRNCPGS